MNMPPPPVIASFFDRRSRRLSIHPTPINTGMSAYWLRAHEACRAHAVDHGYTHWAIALPNNKGWGVYEMTITGKTLVYEAPTQEAAEMWLVHLG